MRRFSFFLLLLILVLFVLPVQADIYKNCNECQEVIEEAYLNDEISAVKKIIFNIYLKYFPEKVPVKYRCEEHKLSPINIRSIRKYPEAYLDEEVVLEGRFMGWDGKYGPPPKTRSDWIIENNDDYIYVVGSFPDNLNPMVEEDIGKLIRIKGLLKKTEGTDFEENELIYYIQLLSTKKGQNIGGNYE